MPGVPPPTPDEPPPTPDEPPPTLDEPPPTPDEPPPTLDEPPPTPDEPPPTPDEPPPTLDEPPPVADEPPPVALVPPPTPDEPPPEPEMLPEQVPFTQLLPRLQIEQTAPRDPQAVDDKPDWHRPAVSQQPDEHVAALQVVVVPHENEDTAKTPATITATRTEVFMGGGAIVSAAHSTQEPRHAARCARTVTSSRSWYS